MEIVEARGRTAREIARWRPRVGSGCLSPIFPLHPPSQASYPSCFSHGYPYSLVVAAFQWQGFGGGKMTAHSDQEQEQQ